MDLREVLESKLEEACNVARGYAVLVVVRKDQTSEVTANPAEYLLMVRRKTAFLESFSFLAVLFSFPFVKGTGGAAAD